MSNIDLTNLLRWMAIPEIEKSIDLKLKEIRIQFKDRIDALESKMTNHAPQAPMFFDFVLEKRGDSWVRLIDLAGHELELCYILPDSLVERIVLQEPIQNKILLLKERLYNFVTKTFQDYTIRYICKSPAAYEGRIKITEFTTPGAKAIILEFNVDHLSLSECRDIETYIQDVLSNPTLRRVVLHDYNYKLKPVLDNTCNTQLADVISS